MNDYKTRIKETFIERFKGLKRKEINGKVPTNEELAEALDVSISSIYKWLSPDDLTIPWKSLYSICDFYGVDPEYLLLPKYKNFTIEYDRISEITGLSSKSIEVLKRIKETSGKTSSGMSFGSGIDNHSWKHIAMINYILEDMYDHNYMSDDYNGDEPILSVMYDYLHTENIQHINSLDDVKAFGIVRDGDDLDKVMFFDQETYMQYTLPDPVKLFRRTLMDSIQKWLVDKVEKHKKKTATEETSDSL
ncbi:MAG: helix-turn-helix domain-containing protein [Lachnospiraceae bacterium]|nr:helix-turn-helix domain-containing protein [Lachnospiraceae bacterium]